VYVTSFPQPAERWRISTAGGQDPQWRRDGRELYYVASEGWLMAVSVNPGPTVEAGPPESLFRASFDPQSLAFGSVYSPNHDGQRFLVAESLQSDDPLLAVTMNWTPGER
jgi:hypothetical protein